MYAKQKVLVREDETMVKRHSGYISHNAIGLMEVEIDYTSTPLHWSMSLECELNRHYTR